MSQYSYRPNANDGNPYDRRPVQTPAGARSNLSTGEQQHAGQTAALRLHHLTSVPESVARFAEQGAFSTARLERALHARMEQYTGRDSDRFRQLLRWIKNRQSSAPQAQGNPIAETMDATDGATSVSSIRRDQFQNILEVLGVFATQAQADALFDKYDSSGRGTLSLHELMVRASSALESDFVDASGSAGRSGTVSELASGHNSGPRSDDMFVNRGKRQFLRRKLTGEGERPITPRQAQHLISVPIVVRALREKMRINSKSGDTGSLPRARRTLARVFEFLDPLSLGSLTQEQLVRALHSINFPLGEQHIKLLMEAFPAATAPALLSPTGSQSARGGPPTSSIYAIKTDSFNRPLQDPSAPGFDYVSFVLYVYPDSSLTGTALSTSLFLNHELGRSFFDNMSVEERRKRGLPPTHEQYEAMDREARGLTMHDQGGEGGQYEESKEQQQQQHQGPPRAPTAMSQFARERAPPTPAAPLSPEAHYLTIAGRAPPASWSQSIARNPYLQTVLSKGSNTPGFPAAFSSTLGGATAAGQQQQQQQQQGAQVMQIEHRAQTPAYYSSGSQSARGPQSQQPLPPPTSRDAAAYGGSLPSPPRGIHSSAGARPTTGSQQQQYYQQQQRGLHSSAGGPSSNALNPFNGGASFIPEANFTSGGQGFGRSIPQTPSLGGSMSARGPSSSSSARPSLQQLQHLQHHLQQSQSQQFGVSSSGAGAGAEAFANILAAPAPERRPQTGVSVYKRGGNANRPLPPVRQRL